MTNVEKIRREKLIQQAEGYLDLILCLEGRWSLPDHLVHSITGKALNQLDRLESGSGRKSHAEYLKGQCFRLRQQYEEAVNCFWNSLDTDSENIHSLLGLAWCYKRLDELDLAVESLTRAFEVQPDNPVISFNLACYSSLQGDVDRCCDFLQKAIELDESFRELIDRESDFDTVRNHPQFEFFLSAIA